MATKNAIANYDQQFYINGTKISGITSINGGYEIQQEPINIIGKGFAYPTRQGPLVGRFNINKYYIGKEVLLDYMDETAIKGSIHYGSKSFGFEDAYLMDYSMSAGIGQIPSASASISVYGDIGAGITAEGNTTHPPIEIVNQGSMSLNTDGYENNRVSNFSYTLRINRTPLYAIGKVFPVQVDRQFPILQELSISMEVFDYEIPSIEDYLIKPNQKTLNLIFRNPIDDNLIETFVIKQSRLLSHNISSDTNGVLKIDLSYNGYLNRGDRGYY